ncbi:hypothetical protein P168DRAFT_285576 [Aspergillus campestris IBT 28561]|uniref:DUF7600 domain-containing protein n=1 Tax=Aspergillus campestris (strain IBT 28561) TaxID=1392248 RepID=A0A2I1CR18_ASPC2|nr:uncharacterized protein P168DRAFT_285576 [Aspergillus campestris IBT 28561]PKY00063.1 hypothetical protein P168DRAFT_285576 [Aspergillus campestris IBT 28561]
MVLPYLSPADLVRLFRTSKELLSYADLFCRTNPLHFYRCGTNTAGTEEGKRVLMIALSTWTRLDELNRRWEIVRRAADIARLVPLLAKQLPSIPTLDPGAPLRAVSHSFGLCESFVDIPDHAETIEVCNITLDGKYYVCGIGFISKESSVFCGQRTEHVQTVNISRPTDKIEMAVDALGVRSIKYGSSLWLGDPSVTRCWRGLSLRETHRKIRIVRDALKFRDLSWDRETASSFEETLLIKESIPSLWRHRLFTEEYYAQSYPERERELVNLFGRIPVEAVSFDRDLHAIRIHGINGSSGIDGLSIQTESGTYSVGACHRAPASMTLDAPHESLAEIDVRTACLYSLAVTVRIWHFASVECTDLTWLCSSEPTTTANYPPKPMGFQDQMIAMIYEPSDHLQDLALRGYTFDSKDKDSAPSG